MISGLPFSLRSLQPRIEAAVGSWPIRLSLDHAVKWVMQFDSDDYLLAVRVLENLHVLGLGDIRSTLEVAHTKLLRSAAGKGVPIKRNNTLYAGIGSAAKSGSLIAYHYRIAAEIPEDDFLSGDDEQNLDLRQIENIVLVDDVIGTGKTVTSEVTHIAEEVYALSPTRNIFVLTIAGYEDGIKNVVESTGATVVCALEYGVRDTVAALDGAFFDGLPVVERSAALDRLKHYCRSISTSELGHGGVGGLLVFDHNTPNTTLPIVWHSGKGWLPLFQRSRKIPGAAKILKSVRDEREQANAKSQPIRRQDVELTLFVEGRIDEIFVDRLKLKLGLASRLAVREIAAVALGGLYQSERLLELLKSARKHAVFIFDNDDNSQRAAIRNRTLSSMPILYLRPNFVAMLDIERLYAARDRFPRLPERATDTTDPRWLHELEFAVLKRGPIAANAERISQIIDEFIDLDKYNEFALALNKTVDGLFHPAITAISP